MSGILRLFTRAIFGKVDALEIALGVLFGVSLGLIPLFEVDPGSSFLGLNGLWLGILLIGLILNSSIPTALIVGGICRLLANLFVDQMAFDFGKGMLDESLTPDTVVNFAQSMPYLQLHTYWGFGSAAFAAAAALPLFFISFFIMRSKLSVKDGGAKA